ncbi:F-box only protein 22 [Pygocentrus nattereri]|uniref:FIST C-domain domain-containing protein n=1 Tax=Pygocentrus nattereri TaxID=42514 RepID=A0A3B4E014_PYGNA|nr:F-box only protein 22 [Pygocentrus nattereri]
MEELGAPSSAASSAPADSKAGYVLSNVAEVVERILTFVPTKALLRAARVSRLWRNCARRVLKTQQQMSWLSAFGTSRYEEHVLLGAMEEGLETKYLLPLTALLMVDSEHFNGHNGSYRHKKARKCQDEEESDAMDRLRRLLPKSCDILCIVTPGIVLTPTGLPCTTPKEFMEGEAGFSLLFPAMDGVQIRPFHFCKNSLNQESLEEAGLTGNPDLKVVLLFGYHAYKSGAAVFLNKLLEPLARSNVLIAGGHVEKACIQQRDCCSPGSFGVVGLTLSGSRIQGASVLLDQDVSSPKAAEVTIRRLKAASIPERNTVGFMFACVARGHNHYNNEHNVEADTFHKIFPSVPLFGFFGNGEIGCDRIVKENYTLSETDANGLQHGYTTVMSLVHLG